MQLLTNSRASCFRACPRRHYLRFELGLVPAETSLALRVGKGFHAAVEADDKGLDVEAAIQDRVTDPYDLALVAAMYGAHKSRWADQPFDVVAAEQSFDLPLVNPETGAASTVWRMAGVIDRIVRLPDGRLAIQEYKTTSRDFAPGAEYWLHLHMDSQLSMYVIAARAMGYDVQTVLYDVTRRPALRPLKATPAEARKFTKAGALYANQRETDETPEEYAARVAASIAADPDRHFARIEIARLDQDLDECRRDLWVQQQTIRACQRGGAWYRNPGACFAPVSCDYLPVCQNRDLETNTPSGYVRTADVHPELADATNGGQPVHATAPGLSDASESE